MYHGKHVVGAGSMPFYLTPGILGHTCSYTLKLHDEVSRQGRQLTKAKTH